LVVAYSVLIKPVTNHKLGHTIQCSDQWFVTGQNTVWYDQVYDLLLVRTLSATTKFMICYWSEHYVTTKFMFYYWSKHYMLRPSLWFVAGQNTVCYDQVYDLLLVRTLYVTTKFMIFYWSEHCMLRPMLMICYRSENTMLRPNLWFVTGQNTVWYDHHTVFWPVTNHKLRHTIQCSDQ
jgi:hypothetical protein